MYKNGLDVHRFGITAPKTIGAAVVRNRFKRWAREIYRELDLEHLKDAHDLHIFLGNKKIGKEEFKNVSFQEFKQQFTEALGVVFPDRGIHGDHGHRSL